jgi:hypothetical protein
MAEPEQAELAVVQRFQRAQMQHPVKQLRRMPRGRLAGGIARRSFSVFSRGIESQKNSAGRKAKEIARCEME